MTCLFQCPFLNPHLTTYNSNKGVHIIIIMLELRKCALCQTICGMNSLGPQPNIKDNSPCITWHVSTLSFIHHSTKYNLSKAHAHSPGSSMQKLVHFLPFIKGPDFFSFYSETTKSHFFPWLNSYI